MFYRTLAAAGMAACLATGAFAARAETTIRFSNWLPPTHRNVTDVFMPFFDEIAQVTDGRVKVEVLPKVVGTPQSQIDVVRDGLADMSFVVPSYTPGRYVAAEVGELPLMGNDARVMAPAFWHHFQEYIEPTGEFKGLKVLSTWMITPLQPHTKGRPIKSLADFQGLKLRAANQNTVKALELLGAVPILKSSAEAYEMLSSGAIDGQVTLSNSVAQQNQLDLLDSVTLVPGGMANAVNAMVINPDTWAKIAPEDQKAIEGIAGEKLALAAGTTEYDGDQMALKAFADAGYTIVEADHALRNEIAEKLKPVEDAWIERARAKGIKDPEGQLTSLRKAIADGEAAGTTSD